MNVTSTILFAFLTLLKIMNLISFDAEDVRYQLVSALV